MHTGGGVGGVESSTHPDAELHVFSAVDLHALVEQADLLKVLPVHHEAANQSRAPKKTAEEQMFCTERDAKCLQSLNAKQCSTQTRVRTHN